MKQTLNLLDLLNRGGNIQNMLPEVDSHRFDFSQFKNRLNMETAAVIGHSFGGATTVIGLSEEPRFKFVD